MTRQAFVTLALAIVLAGCGSTTEDRTMSGAGIGAAGGAVLGAVTGLSLIEGVVIGAAAGGATGALTDEETIDLGDPVWASDDDATATEATQTASAQSVDRQPGVEPRQIREIQSGLDRLGFDPGPVDGIMGPRTEAAIRNYQSRHGLPVDGRPSGRLALHIERRLAAD